VFGFVVWFGLARCAASQREEVMERELEESREQPGALVPSYEEPNATIVTVGGSLVSLEPASMSPALITEGINRVLPRLESCASETVGVGKRRRTTMRRGTITVSFVVRDQEARSRTLVKSTLPDTVAECVVDGLHDAGFSPAAEGAKVTYDIVFR
jgi:hypothetical protein